MKRHEWKNTWLILMILATLLCFMPNQVQAADDHVPEGIAMQAEFKPGFGEPLGLFKKTVGSVVTIHASDTIGYWAESDLPLYMKDRVVTPMEGLALLQFLDDSTISVAEDSELTINRFIFDPDKLDRSTFLNLQAGKSRFWVKKLKDYTRSEFKVKTKTLIAGVRGSDFVIVVSQDSTEVFALEDTVLEIVSLASPAKVVVLRSFEKVKVGAGKEVSPIEKITPAEAIRLKQVLPLPYDKGVMQAAGVFETKGESKAEGEETEQQQAEETGIAPAPAAQDQVTTILDAEGGIVLIAEDDLAEPVSVMELGPVTQPTEEDWYKQSLTGGPGVEPGISDQPTGDASGRPDGETTTPSTQTAGRPAPASAAQTDPWLDRALTMSPGYEPYIYDIPLADAGGQVAAEDVIQVVIEDILQDFIQNEVLVPLPGLPGTP